MADGHPTGHHELAAGRELGQLTEGNDRFQVGDARDDRERELRRRSGGGRARGGRGRDRRGRGGGWRRVGRESGAKAAAQEHGRGHGGRQSETPRP
ncbi:MAG: hypothetical protein E6J50_01095 [Chloroflexi bacterium]|nr:MAG: hypothetical protein E6J50_01095 [Chloroflexota bacterium]